MIHTINNVLFVAWLIMTPFIAYHYIMLFVRCWTAWDLAKLKGTDPWEELERLK